MDKYITSLDLPSLKSDDEEFIINYVHENIDRFNSWVNVNNFTSRIGVNVGTGFSNLPIVDEDEQRTFIDLFERNGLFFDYEDVIIVLQRSKNNIIPHTDPGRTCTLAYLVKGEAETKFYSMENFVPNINYANAKLHTEASYVIPQRSWYLFNHSKIHGVENFQDSERIQIALNLTSKFIDYQDAVENWKRILID